MFSSMKKFFGKKAQEEKGASAVEYALIAGLMAAVLIVVMATLGGGITASFNTISNALSGN